MARTVEQPSGTTSAPHLRIGELSRRVGVRPETLRAWERRYALTRPERTDGGYRLYSAADEARIREMTKLIAEGVSAAQAAKLARDAPEVAARTGKGATEAGRAAQATDPAPAVSLAPSLTGSAEPPEPVERPVDQLTDAGERLLAALARFDETTATVVLDAAFARFSLESVLGELLLPLLAELGARWERDELSVAQEHFCSAFLRGRLLAIARGWGGGDGPLALLACPPGELHDLGLVTFGIALHERGWRVVFFGADTPIATLADAADRLQPDAIVIAAVEPGPLERARDELRELAQGCALLIGGAGAGDELAAVVGGAYLGADQVQVAELLGSSVGAG